MFNFSSMITKDNITAVMPIIGGNNILTMRPGIPLFFYNDRTFKYYKETRGGVMTCITVPFIGSNIDAMVLATYSPGAVNRRSIRTLCDNYTPEQRLSLVSQKLVFGLVEGNNNTEVVVATDRFIDLDGQIIDSNNQILDDR
jgi:hypothetical protein